MAMLEDFYANVVDLVPRLMEDALKENGDTTMDLVTEEEIKKAREYLFKTGLVTLLLIGADHGHYGAMKNLMQQNMAMGTNIYPKLVDETMNVLNTFEKTNKSRIGGKPFQRNNNSTKVAFVQKDISDVTYYHCSKKGHLARTCPSKRPTMKLIFILR